MLLYEVVWRFRQLWFLVSCLTWAYHAVRHRNYSRENQRLIDEIDRKHKKLETAARKCMRTCRRETRASVVLLPVLGLKVINQLEKTYGTSLSYVDASSSFSANDLDGVSDASMEAHDTSASSNTLTDDEHVSKN